MTELAIDSQFGVIRCQIEENLRGIDANGMQTSGAVTRVWLTPKANRISSHTALARSISAAMAAWLEGETDALRSIGVCQPGTVFQQSVWQAMRSIVPGQPVSYSALAAMAGNPGAVRAAASTCAKNQIPLIVPCHRVINANGSIGRYSIGENGVALKRALLDFESQATR